MKKLLSLFAGLCLFALPGFTQTVGPVSISGSNCGIPPASIGTFDKAATVAINVSGSWSGTLLTQGTVQGQAAFSVLVTPAASTVPQSGITANGGYTVSVAGLSTFKMCGSAITGTAVVVMNASQGYSSLAASGGSISGSGVVVTSSGTTAPSPLSTSACPTGQGVWQYILKADGNYQDTSSLDITTVSPPTTPAGTINNCWRTLFNNSGAAANQMTNQFLGIIYSPGQGGVTSNGTTQSRAIGAVWTNEFAGSSQDYDQENTSYMEALVSGANTNFHGHAGGEIDLGIYRGSFNDSRTANAGSAPALFTTFSGQMTRSNAGATMSTSSGKWVNYRGYVLNSGGGVITANQEFDNFYADGAGNTGGATSGLAYYGFHSAAMTSRFPQFNAGFFSENFGTNANDYDFGAAGVNASGTPAGYNFFTGPTVFGAQAQAASGDQVNVRGGALSVTNGPVYLGSSTPTALSGFSTTDDPFGTSKSAFAIQLGPTTSATTGAAATFNMEPADGVTTGQNFNTVNIGVGTDSTQTKNFGTLRGVLMVGFPQTSGTITNLFGMEIQNTPAGSGNITNASGLRVESATAGLTGNITANSSIQVLRSGFVTNPASPATITTDAGISVGGPATVANGTMTHHYGIQITGTHTGGTGNADGWAFFDATTANKYQFGTVSTLGTITSPAQIISTLATGTAPFVVASTTNVANLNASSLGGATFAAPGAIGSGTASTGAFTTLTGTTHNTTTNCAGVGTAASPSVASCTSAAAGAFSCATNASGATCQVNTTAVTANSRILIQESAAEGANLGVTCNTAPTVVPAVLLASKSAGASFTINMPTITTNPACFVYSIMN